MAKARIRLESINPKDIDMVVDQLNMLSKALKIKLVGPVYLPTKRLKLTVRRTPCGDGSDTYEKWEKRISRRIIDIEGDSKAIRQVLRIKIPESVFVKIILRE